MNRGKGRRFWPVLFAFIAIQVAAVILVELRSGPEGLFLRLLFNPERSTMMLGAWALLLIVQSIAMRGVLERRWSLRQLMTLLVCLCVATALLAQAPAWRGIG